jgi:hypothetical protein
MDYEDELNVRLEGRWLPSVSLKPLYDIRPVSTKYTWFHSLDDTIQPKVELKQYKEYSPKVFNPGQRAPVDYYLNSIDIESKLRSQFMALQKSSQAVYVPELTSDMYTIPGGTKTKEFTEIYSIQCRMPPANLDTFTFGNMTRLQIKK